MRDPIHAMQTTIQDALDALSSPRSSTECRLQALRSLECELAQAVGSSGDTPEKLQAFLALQYTFECNIPSRLLAWIQYSTPTLEFLTNKGNTDQNQEEAVKLANQITLSLSLIQGVVLNHIASKRGLGRKYALETLLDLLLVSRHLSTSSPSPQSATNPPATTPLSSIVLDTLLCILVDSPTALRAFESANGVQLVVKILKRAGTPREVRMKCLEFLYFYLLDEKTPKNASSPSTTPATTLQPTDTAPPTPARPQINKSKSKPYLTSSPLHPSSRSASSASFNAFPSLSTIPNVSPRSASGSSSTSFSSASSNTSLSTAPSSLSTSPEKPSAINQARPGTPPLRRHASGNRLPHLQPRSLMMLRKDVEFVPVSPRKAVGGHTRAARSLSNLGSFTGRGQWDVKTDESEGRAEFVRGGQEGVVRDRGETGDHGGEREDSGDGDDSDEWTRTTAEKKELLGTMLGNVDALVEGVRKAGVWGLG